VVKEFVDHYLAERFHQGIGGQLIKIHACSAKDNGTSEDRLSLATRFVAELLPPWGCLSRSDGFSDTTRSGSLHWRPSHRAARTNSKPPPDVDARTVTLQEHRKRCPPQ